MEIRIYYKQLEEWVINLKNKYIQDIYFRTECNVIFFQIFFAIVLLIIFILSFNHLYQNITETLVKHITESLLKSKTIGSADIVNSLEEIKKDDLFMVLSLTMAITILFGYFGAKIALTPTKSALSSQKLFISNIAHELRSPISVIKTNSEVALMHNHLDQQIEQTIKSNIEELNRVSGIINNLLSLTTLVQPGKLPFSDVDFSIVVDNVLKQTIRLAQNKNLEIEVNKIKPVIVWGNMTALEQVVTNLIKNSINHTQKGGSIKISIEPDYQGNVVLKIKDSGSGISAKDLFHIFEPFYKSESSRTRNTNSESGGLGLTIVSEMVKLHSGKIIISSKLNKGTTATVIFPFSKNFQNTKKISTEETGEVSVDFLNKNNHNS